MDRDVRVLLSEEEVNDIVVRLGKQITEDYQGKDLIVVGILKGASVFMSDLIRKIDKHIEIDYMVVSSYGHSTESSGVVKILKDLSVPIENKHLLIVEDIVDTGLTLSYLTKNLMTRNPESVKICSLLNKPSRRKTDVYIDYLGIDIEDHFVVGYGIDFAEKYRNLPYLGIYTGE